MYKTKRLSFSARARSGFSLVEMIGVLAIIAILAVIIVPKVFSTIASSRVTNAVGSITSMKTAISDFAGKYGTVPLGNGVSRIDDLLVTAGIIDSRFAVKIGTQPANPPLVGSTWNNANGTWVAVVAGAVNQNAQSRLICQNAAPAAVPSTAGTNFFLNGGATGLPAGSRVICAVIPGLTISDARELSLRIDGDVNTQPTTSSLADNAGKVVYGVPNGAGVTTAYVYLAHQ